MNPDLMEEYAPNLLKWFLGGLSGSSLSFKEGGGKFQLSTLRINEKNRLFFLVVEGRELLRDVPFNRVLAHIEEEHVFGHDYKKTPFFDPHHIRNYIAKHHEAFLSALSQEALLEWVKAHLPRLNQQEVPEPQSFPLMPYNRSWVELSVDQFKAYKRLLPYINSGPGGAGKTLLELAHAMRYLEELPEELTDNRESFKQLRYVTVNEPTANSMRRNAAGLLDAPGKRVVVSILTYEEGFKAALKADKEHENWTVVSKSEFPIWFRGFYGHQKKLSASSSNRKKKSQVVSEELVQRVFEELQWIRLRTVQPDLPMGKRRSLFPEESEQAYLKEVLSKYKSHLISGKKIQSEFYFFPANTANSIDLMCVDEAHGLGPVQLFNLIQQTKNYQLIISYDTHQEIEYLLPKRTWLIELLMKQTGRDEEGVHHSSIVTKRCSKNVVTVLNNWLSVVTNAINQGMTDKYEYDQVGMEEAAPERLGRFDCFLGEDALKHYEAAYKPVQDRSRIAILTREEFKKEASDKFKTKNVYDVLEFRGLENDIIILYNLFVDPIFKQMNQLVVDYQEKQTQTQLSGKKGRGKHLERRYQQACSEITTAIGRAQNELCIVQTEGVHSVSQLLSTLKLNTKNEVIQEEAVLSQKEKWERWEKVVQNLIWTEADEKAKDIFESELKLAELGAWSDYLETQRKVNETAIETFEQPARKQDNLIRFEAFSEEKWLELINTKKAIRVLFQSPYGKYQYALEAIWAERSTGETSFSKVMSKNVGFIKEIVTKICKMKRNKINTDMLYQTEKGSIYLGQFLLGAKELKLDWFSHDNFSTRFTELVHTACWADATLGLINMIVLHNSPPSALIKKRFKNNANIWVSDLLISLARKEEADRIVESIDLCAEVADPKGEKRPLFIWLKRSKETNLLLANILNNHKNIIRFISQLFEGNTPPIWWIINHPSTHDLLIFLRKQDPDLFFDYLETIFVDGSNIFSALEKSEVGFALLKDLIRARKDFLEKTEFSFLIKHEEFFQELIVAAEYYLSIKEVFAKNSKDDYRLFYDYICKADVIPHFGQHVVLTMAHQVGIKETLGPQAYIDILCRLISFFLKDKQPTEDYQIYFELILLNCFKDLMNKIQETDGQLALLLIKYPPLWKVIIKQSTEGIAFDWLLKENSKKMRFLEEVLRLNMQSNLSELFKNRKACEFLEKNLGPLQFDRLRAYSNLLDKRLKIATGEYSHEQFVALLDEPFFNQKSLLEHLFRQGVELDVPIAQLIVLLEKSSLNKRGKGSSFLGHFLPIYPRSVFRIMDALQKASDDPSFYIEISSMSSNNFLDSEVNEQLEKMVSNRQQGSKITFTMLDRLQESIANRNETRNRFFSKKWCFAQFFESDIRKYLQDISSNYEQVLLLLRSICNGNVDEAKVLFDQSFTKLYEPVASVFHIITNSEKQALLATLAGTPAFKKVIEKLFKETVKKEDLEGLNADFMWEPVDGKEETVFDALLKNYPEVLARLIIDNKKIQASILLRSRSFQFLMSALSQIIPAGHEALGVLFNSTNKLLLALELNFLFERVSNGETCLNNLLKTENGLCILLLLWRDSPLCLKNEQFPALTELVAGTDYTISEYLIAFSDTSRALLAFWLMSMDNLHHYKIQAFYCEFNYGDLDKEIIVNERRVYLLEMLTDGTNFHELFLAFFESQPKFRASITWENLKKPFRSDPQASLFKTLLNHTYQKGPTLLVKIIEQCPELQAQANNIIRETSHNGIKLWDMIRTSNDSSFVKKFIEMNKLAEEESLEPSPQMNHG